MDISGKVVLVTGGGGGIGSGIAEAFAEGGAEIAVSDLNLEYARAEAERIGPDVLALQHDVTSLASWSLVRAQVEARWGGRSISSATTPASRSRSSRLKRSRRRNSIA